MAPSSYIYTGPDSSLIIGRTTLDRGIPTELEGKTEKAAQRRSDIKKASKPETEPKPKKEKEPEHKPEPKPKEEKEK